MAKDEKIAYEFNAYRRDVMIALCQTKLSGADFRAILLILAQTDGYHRPEDKIKPTFFRDKTGLHDSNLRRTIGRLRRWNMVSKKGQVYTVLPPSKWKSSTFLELNRNEIDTAAAEEHRNGLVTEKAPNRNEIDTISVTKSLRSEDEIVTDLASSKENILKRTTKENIYIDLFNHWNSLKIVQHKKLTDEMKRAIKSALENYTKEEIFEAMKNYAEILAGDEYFFSYRWTLKDFIRRGLEKFMDGEVTQQNYKIKEGGRDERFHTKPQPRRHPITYISGSGKLGSESEEDMP